RAARSPKLGARSRSASGVGVGAKEMRRALTHVGGETVREGAREESAALAHALDVTPSSQEPPAGAHGGREAHRAEAEGAQATPAEGGARGAKPLEQDRAHVHGFHVYPARMHPVTASRLVELTSIAGSKVLDPFCGSGTVLVQAMLARRD